MPTSSSSVAFVALAFLSLFFFIDFVDELGDVGRAATPRCTPRRYSLLLAARAPLRAVPIAVLIGTHLRPGAAGADVAVHDPAHRRPRARAARSGCWRAWAWCSALLTFVVGDYVAPAQRAPGQPAAGAAQRRRRRSAAPAPGSRTTPHAAGRAQLLDQRRRRPRAARCCTTCASSSSTPTAACCGASPPPAAQVAGDAVVDLAATSPSRAGSTARQAPRCAEEQLARARLAQHAVGRRGRRGGAAGRDHVDARALSLHRPPRRQRAGRAAPADPVLEARALPLRLPGHGRPGPALRLPAARAPAASA